MRPGTTRALVRFALGVALLNLAPGWAMAGTWSLPDDARGQRIQPLFLLSRPDVRDDLGVPADQADAIHAEIVAVYRQASALIGKKDAGVVAARRAVDDRALRWIADHLTAEQNARLCEIQYHWEGPAALVYHAAVADALALGDEQKAALGQALAARRARRGPKFDTTAEEQRFAQAAMAILSDTQRKRWEKLLGRPFLLRPVAAPAVAASKG